MDSAVRYPHGEARGISTSLSGVPVHDDETMEPLVFKEGMIIQKRGGYRFSEDAVLLAAIASEFRSTAGTRYLDMGTGCGIVPVLLSRTHTHLCGYAVEIQTSLADMAKRNLALHGVEDRIQTLCADLRTLPDRFPPGSFDWITSNPPYRKVASGRVNPDPQKAVARHEIHSSLADIIRVAAYLLRNKGRLYMIYPASRLAELIAQLRVRDLAPKRLRPVYPSPGERARRVLLEAVLGGGEEMSIERPLCMRDDRGEYTQEVLLMYRGETSSY